jgi:hypothetical protein
MIARKPDEENVILRDLGDGLILRKATQADAEELVAFNSFIHGNQEKGTLDLRVGAWTRDLMTKPHPTFNPNDFTVVVDRKTGKIVSSLNLIPQIWVYEGIPFDVGRPELVGTHPEYRHRGLVRAQFDIIHRWSAERSYKVLAITGIPYYYRLYGYEMALDLGGGRAGFKPNIPQLKADESEPFRLRPGREDDIPFLDCLYRLSWKRHLVNTVWNEALWKYEISSKDPNHVNRKEIRLIETPQGEPVGFLAHQPYRQGALLVAIYYEIKAGLSWAAVTPSVMRYLQAAGAGIDPEIGEEPFGSFYFELGQEHPVYQVLLDRLPRIFKPYAWYLRIPDVPGFLRLIAPALEHRLAQSPMVGHSGELKISFYQEGLQLAFEKGRLVGVKAWKPVPEGHSGNAAFPGLTFLQLLFGYRSLEELKGAFADCITDSPETHALLSFLFPRKSSNLWPIS